MSTALAPESTLTCWIALPAPFRIDPDALIARLKADHGLSNLSVEADSRDSGGPSHADAVTDQTVLLTFDNVQIALACVPEPLSPGTFDLALSLNREWPEADEAFAEARSMIMVTNFTAATEFAEAVYMGALVTLTAASLSAMAPALGLYWAPAETVTSPEMFRERARVLPSGARPMELWTQFALLSDREADGRETTTAIGFGLCPFVGREVEFQPSTEPRLEVARRLLGTMEYLLTKGPVLQDGDTLGVTPAERLRVQTCDSALRAGLPIYALTIEKLAPA